jgi:hypothetical protein
MLTSMETLICPTRGRGRGVRRAVACALGVLGAVVLPSGIATAQSPSSRPCHRSAFTGRVGPARPSLCEKRAQQPSGPRGPQGHAGARGPTGFAGLPGPSGPAGLHGLLGATGPVGTGLAGSNGVTGVAGATGLAGSIGVTGVAGATGLAGPVGLTGAAGPTGSAGPTGLTGATGSAGPTGPQGPPALAAYAEFYALMPSDNAATVAAGSPVQFPQNGPTTGVITRRGGSSSTEFVLPNIGTYRVAFSVSVSEAGQLVIALDDGTGGAARA